MDKRRNKISAEAVKKATGKTLEELFKIIDRESGAKMTHREIARMLYDKKYVKSGWWCQTVTVQYEYARGKRIVGQTLDVGFEIGAQKTFQTIPKKAWELITSKKGQSIWLNPASIISFKPGVKFKTKDGKDGEIRTYDEGKKIRLKLGESILQIYVLVAGQFYLNKTSKVDNSAKKTAIHFHQEKLKSAKERETMRKHWKSVLAKLNNEL